MEIPANVANATPTQDHLTSRDMTVSFLPSLPASVPPTEWSIAVRPVPLLIQINYRRLLPALVLRWVTAHAREERSPPAIARRYRNVTGYRQGAAIWHCGWME
jgi:hypothetical protein